MKGTALFVLFLLCLSSLCGYLLSKATLIGRTGIHLFYRQYRFLKVWWQGALFVFVVLIVLFIIQKIIHNKFSRTTSVIVHSIALLAAIAGLYFTYIDFRQTLSHHLLGERFHVGAYLCWMGWMAISVFFLVKRKHSLY